MGYTVHMHLKQVVWALITSMQRAITPGLVCLNINTLRPRRHFADDIFKCIFLNENIWISIKISLKFVPKDQIDNIPALVQIMVWRRPGDKPLFEPMVVSVLTHICVTRPQWVKLYRIVFVLTRASKSVPPFHDVCPMEGKGLWAALDQTRFYSQCNRIYTQQTY